MGCFEVLIDFCNFIPEERQIEGKGDAWVLISQATATFKKVKKVYISGLEKKVLKGEEETQI